MDHLILWFHNFTPPFTLVLTMAHCKWWHPGWDEQKTCFQVEVAPFAIRQLFHMHWWWNWSSINWVEDEQGRSLLSPVVFGVLALRKSTHLNPWKKKTSWKFGGIWGGLGGKVVEDLNILSIYSMCCWFQVECFMSFITGLGGSRQAQQATATTSNNNSSNSNICERGLRCCWPRMNSG